MALLLAACGGGDPPAPDPSSLRRLGPGEAVGFSDAGAHVWRGLPFAAPPVGPLRWRAPRPASPWREPLQALEYGAICPQLDQSGAIVGKEDCLTLNVFAPRFAPAEVPRGDARLPVMVFIHGGGNSQGSAHPWQGQRLAVENRVVVVTVQYRLGVLGWFSHPALRASAESADDASGNWATLDLVRALEWVRDEISAFGGDPANVTVFGESAGGINVYSLLLSPHARGLFHRAISQSGFPTTFSRAQAEHRVDAPEPGEPNSSAEVLLALLQRDEGEAAADRVAALARADAMSPGEVESYLRDKSAEEILALFQGNAGGVSGGVYVAPFVIRDGHVIPQALPAEVFAAGEHNPVPVVLGTNRDEHKLFLAFLSPHVRRVFGLPLGLRDRRRYDAVAEYGARLWKAEGADGPATALAASQREGVWVYRFDWDEQARPLGVDLPGLFGAGHAVELLFVFGGTRSGFARNLFLDDVESAERLSRDKRSYWAAMASQGDPAQGQGGDLPSWSPWPAEGAAGRTLVLDSDRDGGIRMTPAREEREALVASVQTDARLQNAEERCEVYRTFVQWSDVIPPEQYPTLDDGACADYPMAGRTVFD